MKMKKLLSLVLSASMVLGSFGYAFAAPADVEGTKYEKAVNRLEALDILNGYEDGSFKPGKTITRAEFAKVMASTLGVGEAAKYAMGETKFNDVPANHWAAGYINVVSDMKVINGRGDGTFGPNDNVTYAEAITMIVRALGYEPKAKAMGGYPGGYLAVASEKDVTEDVSVVTAISANRGDVAIMVENALDVDMMVQKEYGQNPTWEEEKGKTLLSDKHNIDEKTGFVTAIPRTDDSLDENEFELDGKTFELKVEQNMDELLGVEVTIWTNDDEEVYFVDTETDEDDIMFDVVDKDVASGAKEITLRVEDDDFDLSTDKDGDVTTEVTLNFDEKADLDDIKAGDYGYFVKDSKGDIKSINVIRGKSISKGVVYEIKGDEYKYVETESASEEEIDFSDYEDGVVVYDAKFNVVDEDMIKKNSVIYAFEDKDKDLDKLYIFVSNKTAEGELERVRKDEFKIAGKKYDTSEEVTFSTDNLDDFDLFNKSDIESIDDLNGEDVVAALDLDGDVIMVYGDVQATSSTIYGIATYGETGSKSEVTIFAKEGNSTDYKFEDRAEGTPVADTNQKYFGKVVNDAGTNLIDATKSDLKFPVVVFSLNSDGEVSEEDNAIINIDTSKAVDSNDFAIVAHDIKGETTEFATGTLTKKSDKDYVEITGKDEGDNAITDKKFYISEDTVFMTAVDGEELDPEVLTYKNIYETEIKGSNEVIVIGEPNRDADMIIFLNEEFEGTDDDYYYGIVTDSPSKTGDDYVVKVDIAGEGEKEIVINKSDRSYLIEGKTIQFKYDNKGEMSLTSAVKGTDDKVEITEEIKALENGKAVVTMFDYDDGFVEITRSTLDDKGTPADTSDDTVTKAVDTIKVAKDVVIYKTDDTSATDRDLDGKTSVSKIDKFKLINYIVDEDGIIKAIVMENEK